MELTRIYAKELREALKSAVDTRKLAEAWAALHPKDFTAKALDPALSAFLSRAGQAIRAALAKVLPKAWTEGWALGQQSAIASAASRSVQASAELPKVNWGEWMPGDPEAAYQVAGSGLRDLLASQEVTIKSIAGSRLEELGDILAAHIGSTETLRSADLSEPVPPMYSVDSLADALEEVLDNPERAVMVAHTELARASQTAAQWVFQNLGVGEVRVSTAGDTRVCVVCRSAETAGAQPIGTYTVPLHPMCRCATVAAMPPFSPLPSLPGVPESAMPELGEAADEAEEAPEPMSDGEARDWLAARVPDLTEDQEEALSSYLEDGFEAVNPALRSGAEPDRVARQLDSAMSPLPQSLALSRVVTPEAFPGGMPAEDAVIADAAYASTSLGGPPSGDAIATADGRTWDEIAADGVLMHITAPAGTPALNTAGVSAFSAEERELILARGTQMRVDRVQGRELWATVLGGGTAKSLAKSLAKAGGKRKGSGLAARMADAEYLMVG